MQIPLKLTSSIQLKTFNFQANDNFLFFLLKSLSQWGSLTPKLPTGYATDLVDFSRYKI